MNTETIYDEIVSGRRLVILKHQLQNPLKPMDFSVWYCGYLQILPSDDIWSKATFNFPGKDTHLWELSEDPRLDASQELGGITWTGPLPYHNNDDTRFVGFDTGHWGMENVDEGEVMTVLRRMMKAMNKHPKLVVNDED